MNEALTQDPFYMQRLLRLAGYYKGKVDGIAGRLTKQAVEAWNREEQEAKKQGVFDERTEKNLSTLIPQAQKAVRTWLANSVAGYAEQNGLQAKVICGTRTFAEQDALYSQGRTKKGAIITNARGGYSFHNFGIAFDLGLFRGGKYLEADKPYSDLAKHCGKPLGFSWGGDWQSFKDCPHYQLDKFGKTAREVRENFL